MRVRIPRHPTDTIPTRVNPSQRTETKFDTKGTLSQIRPSTQVQVRYTKVRLSRHRHVPYEKGTLLWSYILGSGVATHVNSRDQYNTDDRKVTSFLRYYDSGCRHLVPLYEPGVFLPRTRNELSLGLLVLIRCVGVLFDRK